MLLYERDLRVHCSSMTVCSVLMSSIINNSILYTSRCVGNDCAGVAKERVLFCPLGTEKRPAWGSRSECTQLRPQCVITPRETGRIVVGATYIHVWRTMPTRSVIQETERRNLHCPALAVPSTVSFYSNSPANVEKNLQSYGETIVVYTPC